MFVPKTKPDLYSQEHPIESEELVMAKLDELQAELDRISDAEKTAYMQALENCPQLVSNKEKVQFLRCEVFNADLAAKRLVAYWEKRLEVFGPDRAFLPLTISGTGALQDGDLIALERGVIRLLPVKADPGHRNVLFFDPSRQDQSQYTTMEMVRALWYMVHVALEDEASQCKGLIMLGYPHKAKLAQFDRQLAKNMMSSIRGCLPLRLSALHLCHPPSFFQIVFPILKLLLGDRLRKRINIHCGSQEHVLERLENKYGLHRENLPTELGGSIVLDHNTWLKERRSKEQE